MLETVRARLTLWYVSVLGAVLMVVTVTIYVLLARTLYSRIDDDLYRVVAISINSLANDLAEGQDAEDAARSTAAEIASSEQLLAIFDSSGRLLAEAERPDDLDIELPGEEIPDDEPLVYTVTEKKDLDDRHRLAVRRVSLDDGRREYIVLVGTSLEPVDEELESLRGILFWVVPMGLVIAGIGGWFLARRSLEPVVTMAERARRIGVENIEARLPVQNPRDELGRLAETFNELLGRLATSLTQQRQFMADASHELRTPVATARTAAGVALQADRSAAEYRESLALIEQETARLSRIVDDMFTLARADAGNYPLRHAPLYLDELVDESVRASRVLAAARRVNIDYSCVTGAALTGDEDLLRRLVGNVLGNAIRYAPEGSSVRVSLTTAGGQYRITVADDGPGVPLEAQPHIFERFYRADASRGRGTPDEGAGLGLALAKWVANAHGGDVALESSSASGTVFIITLPANGSA
jgi:heavy metal sensor kinase